MSWTAVATGLVGVMIAFTAAGYIRAMLAEIDPNYSAPPSRLQGPLLGDIAPAIHYRKLKGWAAATLLFFLGAALFVIGLFQLVTSWD